MAILGGSPLGLIGLKSMSDSKTGMSTFNGGLSRNVKVSEYNRSRAGSIFSGKRRLRAWPNISGKIAKGVKIAQDGTTSDDPENDDVDTTGTADVSYEVQSDGTIKVKDGYQSPMGKPGAKGQNVLHNNDVYDTSVLNLIEKLAPTKGALKPADFAYLKDLGVYPNNRLMICRRFITPSGDNIMVNNLKNGKARDVSSLGTMISWIPEGDNFLSITFGEVWEEAKADFTGILNSLGEDFGKSGVGGIAGAAGGALPLPGFTEIFQRMFLEHFGLLDKGSGSGIPAGNPNLIKEAKVRHTVGYGEAGSGLATTINITMVCEYELKFISGIDPTIVWMDILGTITRFGTSNSSNYGLSGGVASRLAKWSRNPNSLLTDVIDSVKGIIEKVKKEVVAGLKNIYNAAVDAAKKIKTESDEAENAPKKGEPGYKEVDPAEEAHHFTPDSSWGKVVTGFPSARVLGVTATPERLDGKGMGLMFDDMVMGPTVAELTAQGFLSHAVVYAPSAPDLGSVGTRMGDYLDGFVDEECRGLGLTREAVLAWQPTVTTARRGRRRST